MGVEPWTFTLAELFELATGNSFARWNHTATIQATLANTVRDPKTKSKPWYAHDFHPHILHAERMRRKREGEPERTGETKASISILKDVFVDNVPFAKVLETHGIEA